MLSSPQVKINDDIGDIFKLRIGYQPKPQKADWFLEKVCLLAFSSYLKCNLSGVYIYH